jgi:carbonyl reductase 1
VNRLAAEIAAEHPDGIDVLINNAGVNDNPKGYSKQTITSTLNINYYGTRNVRPVSPVSQTNDVQMCNAFLPLIRSGGRIVNVASVASHLRGYTSEIKDEFHDAAKSTIALTHLVQKYEVGSILHPSTLYSPSV